MKIGELCMKLCGRDAGKECVIVEILKEKNYVMVDGNTRRRKCNIKHLSPLGKELKIKSGISHDEIIKLLNENGIKTEVKSNINNETKKAKNLKKNAKSKE